MARAKQKPTVNSYISNPFSVVAIGFRGALSINIGTLVGLTVLMLGSVLGFALFGAGIIAMAQSVRAGLLLLALFILGLAWMLILSVAFTKYAIATNRGLLISLGQCLRVGYQKAAGFLGLTLLISLVVVAGLVLLIIPGFIFMYWYLLAPFIYIDQDVSIAEAMRISRQLAQKQRAELFGLVAASSIFAIPGMLPIIGILYQVFYNAAGSIAFAYRYDSARNLKAAKPPTHPANYWAIVLALAVYGLLFLGFFAQVSELFKGY